MFITCLPCNPPKSTIHPCRACEVAAGVRSSKRAQGLKLGPRNSGWVRPAPLFAGSESALRGSAVASSPQSTDA
eukprot:11328374-Alexandrium_andersonii.AAC.1